MPRQLQQSFADIDEYVGIAPISNGGTGASDAVTAVANLGGISRSSLGKPNGVLGADSRGYIPSAILIEMGFALGYSLEGPVSLTANNTSVYHITNYNNLSTPVVSAINGVAELFGEEIHVKPNVGATTLTLNVDERSIDIPVYPSGPIPPAIVFPKEGLHVRHRSIIRARAFHSEPEHYSDWINIAQNSEQYTHTPINASGVVVEGFCGAAGLAYVKTTADRHGLGYSYTRLRILKEKDGFFTFYKNGTGRLRYRWIYPIAEHVSTDWEISTDVDFTNIVFFSYGDTVNLTSIETTLDPGVYFVRARYNGLVESASGGVPIEM